MFTDFKQLDKTALQRQNRRLAKLKSDGVCRSTVLVHEQCKLAFDDLRPFFLNPRGAETLTQLVRQLEADQKPTNVAQVQQLSPFRYPGGKTWLVPEVCCWLHSLPATPDVFVEPFAGGAMAGLTTAANKLAYSVVLSEIDEDVAAVWRIIFDGSNQEIDEFCNRITSFEVSLENVRQVLTGLPASRTDRAFRTIIKNRMQRGGIMAAGAGLIKVGEAGRGLNSRWYPETLAKRIQQLRKLSTPVSFLEGDAFATIQQFLQNPQACFFIDPPYTAGGKNAGKRLYTHNSVNHKALFELLAEARGAAMLTYDDAPEVRALAALHKFKVRTTPMKSTHHNVMRELLIFKTTQA